jgi:hypothetical protein
MVAFAGCGGTSEEGAAATAPSMPAVVGEPLDIALEQIESAGIEDEVEIVGGGTFGVVVESNWEVCAQAPAPGSAVSASPELTVDRSCDESATEGTDAPDETTLPKPSASSAETSPSLSAPGQVLTEENSAELAAVLAEPDNCSDTIAQFASRFDGRGIEFDGSIVNVATYDGRTPRYDILISPGDFDETSAVGPTFQFQRVRTAELNLVGSGTSDELVLGNDVHVIAEIIDYQDSSCLFFLDPVSTSLR